MISHVISQTLVCEIDEDGLIDLDEISNVSGAYPYDKESIERESPLEAVLYSIVLKESNRYRYRYDTYDKTSIHKDIAHLHKMGAIGEVVVLYEYHNGREIVVYRLDDSLTTTNLEWVSDAEDRINHLNNNPTPMYPLGTDGMCSQCKKVLPLGKSLGELSKSRFTYLSAYADNIVDIYGLSPDDRLCVDCFDRLGCY